MLRRDFKEDENMPQSAPLNMKPTATARIHMLTYANPYSREVTHMRTVSIFKNSTSQAIRIPKDMEFKGIQELEIRKEGDTLILRPVRPSWSSLANEAAADSDFLQDRPDVVEDGRIDLGQGAE